MPKSSIPIVKNQPRVNLTEKGVNFYEEVDCEEAGHCRDSAWSCGNSCLSLPMSLVKHRSGYPSHGLQRAYIKERVGILVVKLL